MYSQRGGPDPVLYERQIYNETGDAISLYYRYGDGPRIEAGFEKVVNELGICSDRLADAPWTFPAVPDGESVPVEAINTDFVTAFIRQELGLWFDPLRYRLWSGRCKQARVIVDRRAGVVVRDVDGRVVETMVDPLDPGEMP